MASIMGKKCGYGVHLRSCLPLVSSSSVSSNSLASLSRLASCFFLRFSSSSCRNHRLRLCTAPPLSSGRRVRFVHGEEGQEGSTTSCSAFELRQSLLAVPPVKKVSRRKKVDVEIPLDAQTAHASVLEDASTLLPLAVPSSKKVNRKQKVDHEITMDAPTAHAPLLQDASTSLPLAAPLVKKVTRRKKVDQEVTLDAITANASSLEDALTSLSLTMPSTKNVIRKNRSHETTLDAQTANASLVEDASTSSLLAVPSVKKVTRRKKVDHETTLDAQTTPLLEDASTSLALAVPSMEKVTRRRVEHEIMDAQIAHAPLLEDVLTSSSLAVPPTKKVTRRKKVEHETTLDAQTGHTPPHASLLEDALTSSLLAVPSAKKVRRRKKVERETTLDAQTAHASLLEEALPSLPVAVPLVEKVTTRRKVDQEIRVHERQEVMSPTTKRAASEEKIVEQGAEIDPILGVDKSDAQTAQVLLLENASASSLSDVPFTKTFTRRNKVDHKIPLQGREDKFMSHTTPSVKKVVEQGAEIDPILGVDKSAAQSAHAFLLEDALSWSLAVPSVEKVTTGKVVDHERLLQGRKEEFVPHTSRANNSRDTFGAQKQKVSGRNVSPPKWTNRDNQSKTFPSFRQRWAPNKNGNSYKTFGKSPDTTVKHGSVGAAVQRNERSSSMQFATTGRKEMYSQHGYNLANVDRASGMERKKRRGFTVRNVVANQASTISYMQIYGTGFDTGDTTPTVLLFFDRRRFLFNVGEGLHRFCMEHKFKLSKIDHVFLTRVCSETAGGLPGLILTLAEIGETGLTVKTWGPSSLQDLAQAMRTFVPSGWMEHTHCFGPGEDNRAFSESSSSLPILLLEDELIRISAVLLYSENTAYSTVESLFPEERNGGVMSTVYICELSTVRGKFDPDKALAKGLRPGYKYGKLQKGESVMSDDGTTMVHPEDVLGPSSPGPIMFLVDCPDSSYISSLTSSASLQSYFSQAGKVVNCMIHIGPTSVTSSKDYQSWMENFKETHHIMARREVKVLGTPTLTYSAKIISKLNMVCPQLFPVIEFDTRDQKEVARDRVVDGGNLLKYHFRPLSDLGLDGSDIPEAFDRVAAQEKWRMEFPEVIRAREMAGQVFKRWSETHTQSWENKVWDNFTGPKDCQKLPACLQHASRKDMELVFLGTGSSQPAKHRNVTGIYIHLFEKGGILLDCGEGTYAQLKRRYGAKGADDVLMGLKCIWISHMHADHFSGLARILSARRQLLQTQSSSEPILVIGPKRLKLYLDAYGKVEDLVMEFLDCSQTTLEVQRWANKENAKDRGGMVVQRKEGLIRVSSEGGSVKSGMQYFWKQSGFHIQQGIDIAGRESLKRVLNLLGLKDLYSVPVVHCPHAFAVVLEAQGRNTSVNESIPGWKLVFSGDTRPCQALVEAAHGATILIHEATFDDDLIAEAVKKNHSMTKEAIEVGVAAQVYRIILTHFSQRYPTIPSFDNRYRDRTCIAFDMMSVNLADLPIVPKLVPALQLLFSDQTEAEEDLVASV